jgi:hypothetical protein
MVAGFYRRELLGWLRGARGRAVMAASLVLFVAFALYSWNDPWSDGWFDVRLTWLSEDTFYAAYLPYFGRDFLGIGRLLNTVVVIVVLYGLLTRCWKPIARTFGWFLIPIGQVSLYVFIVQVYFALIVANIPLFNAGHVAINTMGHTLVLLAIWLMVRTRFLFGVIPT